MAQPRPTVGLALSGSGNRSSFYIGFLEVLSEQAFPVNFIAAASGASLAAAAYACGTLGEFKQRILSLEGEDLKQMLAKGGKSGVYSLERVEHELRTNFTKGLHFEDVRPLMSFVAADIESGELVDLCMGDIARAACASCTLPGVFEPVRWGSRTLVDGGILSYIPVGSLKKFSPDITIGVNMRGTKNIFSSRLITLKKFLNFFKKIFFIGEVDKFLEDFFMGGDQQNPPVEGIFSVIGKSLDVVIRATRVQSGEDDQCTFLINPNLRTEKRSEFSSQISRLYYEEGRKAAAEHLPALWGAIENYKQKITA